MTFNNFRYKLNNRGYFHVVVLRGNCPTNECCCPMGVMVLRAGYPEGELVLGGNWQRGSCPRDDCPMV